MIHSGAICASGLSRAEFVCGKRTWRPKWCDLLRSDEERRDFVAAGAAAGVSAAFASPVGGVLFSLEEGASFLNQTLTWRMLFSSVTASLLLDMMMSALNGHAEDMSNPGLVSFGYVGDITFKTYEIPIFMIMAIFGGLSGALFVQLNYRVTLLRSRLFVTRWLKVTETVLVAAASAVVLVVLIYSVPDCQPLRGFPQQATGSNKTGSRDVTSQRGNASIVADNGDYGEYIERSDPYGDNGHGFVIKGFCPYGQHSRIADILFKTPEGGLHAILHAPLDEWSFGPLIVLVVVYHLMATCTYGVMASSGIFIPALLIGGVWGRIVGMLLMRGLPGIGTKVSKYALVGAACQLGGTVRMTISLAVIILECTGDITFGVPIILSLFVAKWIGDFFNPGIYDLHIEIMGIPLLPWKPPDMCYNVNASDVMSAPVICLRTVEKIRRIVKILGLESLSHNGFPVVEDYTPENSDPTTVTFGRLKGFILKSQLERILLGQDNNISEEELDSVIDLRMHMDRSPYIVQEDVSLPKIFKLFRGIGLRHLVVVNDRNMVVGIITRINLAKYRAESKKGQLKLAELEIDDR
ncbi:hypothetical protein NP493_422g00000 [Ridgeia piscesae]|uniref:Chloride channel protein n=1 Tax=Ridgeia piscesae TaxID=27915 RepID=A0AAD9NSK8_RIDPI|nr:hypothetical protein NP493_422g00000 [Ridgeia piscesae]